MRKKLVGTRRGNDGRQLALLPDGKFSVGTMSGYWDVDGSKLLLRSACVNYGAQDDSVVLTLTESTDQCAFALTADHLALRDCIYAGSYRK
jgi:hypothetical protein